MTKEQMIEFGVAVKAAREAQGLDITGLLRRVYAEAPDVTVSRSTLLRIENGGRFASEPQLAAGQHVVLSTDQMTTRKVVAKVLGVALPSEAVTIPVATPAPVAQTVPVVAAPDKTSKSKAADASRATLTKARAVAKERRVSFKQTGGLITLHGFSLSAIRKTLTSLNNMGLPTAAVKEAIKKQFSDAVDSLDK